MVPHLQMHQGLAKQSLFHGASQHTAGFQRKEVVQNFKYKVVEHSHWHGTKPESSIREHQGTGFGDFMKW